MSFKPKPPRKIAFSCIDRTEAMNEKIDNEQVGIQLPVSRA